MNRLNKKRKEFDMEKLKFEDMNISEEVKKAIIDMGFEEASPIQSQSIPHIIEGLDMIGQSQTGTGKTAAFGIPLVEMNESKAKNPQSIVLCPTRELAIQVAEEIKKLAKYKSGIRVLPVYGGQSIERQIQVLKKGVNIVIGTPGRVMDHIRRKTLKLDGIKRIVLDEADEMFDMGFREDIEEVINLLPEHRQSIFFSATMDKEIIKFAKKFQNNPKIVKVVHKELTVPKIEQYYFEVKQSMKTETLSRLIDIYNPKLSLVFCNTKRRVDELVIQLQARGYFADALHGDLKQAQRDRVMDKFRTGTIDILVATDVAARGIDVDDVDVVFNYDIPQDEEYYVHRIGRTARAGRSGKAFSFAVGKDIYKLRDIQRYTKTKIIRKNIPTISDVEESKTNILLEKIKYEMENGELSKYEKVLQILVEQEYNSLDIAAALLKLYIGESKRNENEEIDVEDNIQDTGAESGMARLFINIGKNQHIRPGDIVGAITGETNLSGKLIGKIDMFDKYTFVEVPREYAKEVLFSLKDNRIKGKKINIEPANPKNR
jgi:ATP-dependent RNA helicase DeaD